MEILGQSVKDISEKFFHALYVSAQGDFYTGPPADGNIPNDAVLQIGDPALNLFLLIMFIAVLAVASMYFIQQYRVLGVKTHATPVQ